VVVLVFLQALLARLLVILEVEAVVVKEQVYILVVLAVLVAAMAEIQPITFLHLLVMVWQTLAAVAGVAEAQVEHRIQALAQQAVQAS
jgi:hypothetical protein